LTKLAKRRGSRQTGSRGNEAGRDTQEPSPAENIDAILRLEKQEEKALAAHQRLFHWIGWFVGTTQFIVLQFVGVAVWMAFNVWLPQRAIDEYPFPLLALILALEAVLLTSCVLIRQGTTTAALSAATISNSRSISLRKARRPDRCAYCSASRSASNATMTTTARRTNSPARRRSMRSRGI
jgi:uncharacterized membrane protein